MHRRQRRCRLGDRRRFAPHLLRAFRPCRDAPSDLRGVSLGFLKPVWPPGRSQFTVIWGNGVL